MSARIFNQVSRTPTQTESVTHQKHTSSMVKLYEAIQLAIFRTIDTYSDFEQLQYQTRPNTSPGQGGLMVTIFARECGMDLLDHLRGVWYEKLLLFFFWVYPALQDRGLARPVVLDASSDLKGFYG